MLPPEIAAEAGLSAPIGCLVRRVLRGLPAEKAGILENDIILEVDGKKIRDSRSFRTMVYFRSPGELLNLFVRRGKEDLRIQVPVGNRAEEAVTEAGQSIQGLKVRPAKSGEGIVIEAIEEGSKGASFWLRKGDVILAVNGTKVNEVNTFAAEFNRAIESGTVKLRVKRQGIILEIQNSIGNEDDDV
jgi:S1-C subfamily serine protease